MPLKHHLKVSRLKPIKKHVFNYTFRLGKSTIPVLISQIKPSIFLSYSLLKCPDHSYRYSNIQRYVSIMKLFIIFYNITMKDENVYQGRRAGRALVINDPISFELDRVFKTLLYFNNTEELTR